MAFKNILFVFIIGWEIFEVCNIFTETVIQKSISPIFKVIFLIRDKATLWFVKLWVDENKSLNINQNDNSLSFVSISNIDVYGNLSHSLLILISASIIGLMSNTIWVRTTQIGILSCVLLLLVLDLINWLPVSINLFFNSLSRIVEFAEMDKKIFAGSNWRQKIELLKDSIEQINIGKLIPYFLFRFIVIVFLITFVFSFQYTIISEIQIGSFIDSNGTAVTGFWNFLYKSIMMTTTIDSPYDPVTIGAKISTAAQSVIIFCLLMIVITFFAFISEERFNIEKKDFLNHIEDILTDEE